MDDKLSLRQAEKVVTTLSLLQKSLHATAKSKGFWEGERSIPECLALIHSEVSEVLEEYRRCGPGSQLQNTTYREDGKPEGFGTELADILIRVFDLAEALGINLSVRLLEKHAYNRTRPHRHGKAC